MNKKQSQEKPVKVMFRRYKDSPDNYRNPSNAALEIADIILNGKGYIFTEFGRKNRFEIAYLIDARMKSKKA